MAALNALDIAFPKRQFKTSLTVSPLNGTPMNKPSVLTFPIGVSGISPTTFFSINRPHQSFTRNSYPTFGPIDFPHSDDQELH